ncbi:hypothetical protein ACHAQH_003099 [Verticillium albo-atrum]
MAIQGIKVPIPGEVTIASSAAGAPRLDFPRFSFFGQEQDDAEKSALPRTQSSSDTLNMAMNSTDAVQRASLDNGSRIRARDNGERSDISDLIQFLRTESPPPHNYLASAFDDDADMVEDTGKWRQLRKRIRAKLNKPTPALSVEIRPRTALPDSAVASKTSSGHSHIAISIPMEHCHLGPDSDWAVTAFNATKPLPPSPPPDSRTSSGSRDRALRPRHENGSVSAPGTAHGDSEWLSMMKASKKSAAPKMQPKNSDSSVLLWHCDVPISPPRSPPSTASGSSTKGRSPSTPAQMHRVPMPMDPNDHVEVPRSSTSSPRTPETIMEDRLRKVHVSWMTTTNMLQSAPGPPPRSASASSPKRSKRPDDIKLPTRKSSLKTPIAAAMSGQNQWSIDGMLETKYEPDNRLHAPIELPELSPSTFSFSGKSIATSIVSEGSEPVVQNARAVRGYSNASVVLQTTPGATPRASLIQLPASKYSPPAATTSPSKAGRKLPVKMNARRQSRAERVKSLKQRDMELARAQLNHNRQASDSTQSVGRPRTAGTSISSLRLPSRDGPHQNGPSLSEFTDQFPRPPTADHAPEHIAYSLSREQQPVRRTESASLSPQAEAEVEFENEGGYLEKRDSTMSFEPPRRYNSYQRTSWASSIPLLDRISSYAPSEASFMNILDSVSSEPNPHRRSDSATLPRIEQERLAPSRLSYMMPFPDMEPEDDRDQVADSVIGDQASSEAPVLQPISRLSAILPMAEGRVLSSYVERWSASTLTSPTDDMMLSSPPTSVSNRQSGESIPRWNSLEENVFGSQPAAHSNSLIRVEPEATSSSQRLGHPGQPLPRLYGESHLAPDEDPYYADHLVPQRSSHALLRMSSSELRAHYASLRRSERATDLAHHMLLNQERLELDMRRQERNQMFFIGRLERALGDLSTRAPARVPSHASAPSVWSEPEVDREAPTPMGDHTPRRVRVNRTSKPVDEALDATERERGRRRVGEIRPRTAVAASNGQRRSSHQGQQQQQQQHGDVTNTGGLDAMEPLMRELHGAARVSLERSDRRRSRTLESTSTTVEERELNAYLNMF